MPLDENPPPVPEGTPPPFPGNTDEPETEQVEEEQVNEDHDRDDDEEEILATMQYEAMIAQMAVGLFAGFCCKDEEPPPIPPIMWWPDNPASSVERVNEEQVNDAATSSPLRTRTVEEAENHEIDEEVGVEKYEDSIPAS